MRKLSKKRQKHIRAQRDAFRRFVRNKELTILRRIAELCDVVLATAALNMYKPEVREFMELREKAREMMK